MVRRGWWAYDVGASPAYLVNTGRAPNCRIMDCSVSAPNSTKVWIAAGKRSIARGAPLLVAYGRHSNHHAKILEESVGAPAAKCALEPRRLAGAREAAQGRKRQLLCQLAAARKRARAGL